MKKNKLLFVALTMLTIFVSLSFGSTVGIIVNSDFYPQIRESVQKYADDIRTIEKKEVWIDSTSFSDTSLSGASPEKDLRDTLINHWKNDELEGAVLIGDFPIVELIDLSVGYDEPTDVYFMDLNGRWTGRKLPVTNGYPNSYADPRGIIKYENYKGDISGNKDVEIWLTRLIPSRMTKYMEKYNFENIQTEKEIIDSYFSRVRKRMYGLDERPKTAYAVATDFTVNVWDFFRNKSKLVKYYNSVPYEYLPNATTYKSRLQSGHELVCVMAHSDAASHSFGSGTYFYLREFIQMSPPSKVNFFITSACHNSDITKYNFGTAYALLHDGLISFGSGTGCGIYHEPNLFNPLGKDSTFGATLKNWFNSKPGANKKNYLAHIMQGVGTLHIKQYPELSVPVVSTKESVSSSGMLAYFEQGSLFFVLPNSNSTVLVTISLYTLKGRLIKRAYRNMIDGNLSVKVDRGELGISKGVYLCRVSVAGIKRALKFNISE